MNNQILYFIFAVFIACNSKTKINDVAQTKGNNLEAIDGFRKIKLPFSSDSINFELDSLGYAIPGKLNYKILNNKIFNSSKIIPIGYYNDEKYYVFIYGQGMPEEELLQPIIYAKSVEIKSMNTIDSLELQVYKAWDYSLERTFFINQNRAIKIKEELTTYNLENANENGDISVNYFNYNLNDQGIFDSIQNKETNNGQIDEILKTPKGSYYLESEAISNYNQEIIHLKYYLSFESNNKVILSIGADQVQDYYCEGEYVLREKNEILHATGICSDDDDQSDFYVTYNQGKYYIKSKRFINQDWQELKKE